MKKYIALLLVAVMAMAMVACGAVNKSEVSILWSGEGEVKTPNSLINAMERAMYIENITYKHYGANGDQAKQTQQAQAALDVGCAALVVELVDGSQAQTLVDMAKAKNVPIVFFGCDVERSVVDSYEKCAAVCTDETTLPESFFEMVSTYVLENTELTKEGKKPADDDMDLDDDGKISYVTVGEITLTEMMAIEKNKKGKPKLEKDGSYKKAVGLVSISATFDQLKVVETVEKGGLFGRETTYRQLQTPDGKTVEMILVADDLQAMTTYRALQEMDLNTNRLATCFVPVFTVGAEADYKTEVLSGKPAGELNSDAVQAYFQENAVFADLTTVETDKDLEKMGKQMDALVLNTMNIIDTGRLCGTAVEDDDALAEAAAELTAKLLKGKNLGETYVLVAYTTYA